MDAEGKSLFLDLNNYPKTDICIVYLGQNNGRNALLVWGYQWQGTYASSLFAANPETVIQRTIYEWEELYWKAQKYEQLKDIILGFDAYAKSGKGELTYVEGDERSVF